MTNIMESRDAAVDDAGSGDGALAAGGEGELAALVRRWMRAGHGPDRARREGLLRVAPVAPELARPAEDLLEDLPEDRIEDPKEDPIEEPVESVEEPVEESLDEPAAVAGTTDAPTLRPRVETDLIEAGQPGTEAPVGRPAPRVPALPHRQSAEEVDAARRVAVLIDARRVSEDVASGLLARLSERGPVNVCRAYADWSRTDLGAWVARLRRQGLHSFHQFADDDDQALVAMAIDAVDIARDAAIDEIVIAGDMTSMLPLVHRLHAAGVRVVIVGPGHTPYDVRAACDEFLEAGSVSSHEAVTVGRHRAY